MHIRQAEAATLVFEGQLLMVDAQDVQQRSLKIVDVDAVLHNVVAKILKSLSDGVVFSLGVFFFLVFVKIVHHLIFLCIRLAAQQCTEGYLKLPIRPRFLHFYFFSQHAGGFDHLRSVQQHQRLQRRTGRAAFCGQEWAITKCNLLFFNSKEYPFMPSRSSSAWTKMLTSL